MISNINLFYPKYDFPFQKKHMASPTSEYFGNGLKQWKEPFK